MIQKGTQAVVSDKSGVWTVNVFHIYRGYQHKKAFCGDFLRVSVRKTKPNNFFKSGKKSKAYIIRTVFKKIKNDGSYIRARTNAVVLLKKRMNTRSKELVGPIFYGLKRRRFSSAFHTKV